LNTPFRSSFWTDAQYSFLKSFTVRVSIAGLALVIAFIVANIIIDRNVSSKLFMLLYGLFSAILTSSVLAGMYSRSEHKYCKNNAEVQDGRDGSTACSAQVTSLLSYRDVSNTNSPPILGARSHILIGSYGVVLAFSFS